MSNPSKIEFTEPSTGAVNDGNDPALDLSNEAEGGVALKAVAKGRAINGRCSSGIGVLGETDTGQGVFGVSRAGVGVEGKSTSERGVYGKSEQAAGVYGESTAGDGVKGVSTNAAGVAGSSNHIGIWGQGTGADKLAGWFEGNVKVTGVITGTSVAADGVKGGVITGTSVAADGVKGESTNAVGVYGKSTAADGVKGESTNAAGVAGSSTNQYGIWGHSTGNIGIWGGSDVTHGVYGHSKLFDGIKGETDSNAAGVAGIAVNGTGIYGQGGDWGGRFEGSVLVTKDLQYLGRLIGTHGDCAEDFDIIEENVDAGTVMVLNEMGSLQPSNMEYDKKVTGIISGASGYGPAIVLDRQQQHSQDEDQNDKKKNRLPIALMGKVYCKVDARNSSIEIGDLLTTSSTKGHAMKAVDPTKSFGAVIGKALGAIEGELGMIPVLVALQ